MIRQRSALVIVVAVLVSACGRSGVESAIEIDSFSSCVDSTDATYDGADGWDTFDQLEFWAEPGTLACAVAELDDDELHDALGDAFGDPDDLGTDAQSLTAYTGQLSAVHVLAVDVASEGGPDAAVAAVASVIDAGWFEDDDDSREARRVAAFGIVEEAGLLTGFDDYRARQEGSNLEAVDLVTHYLADIRRHTAESEEVRDRLDELEDQIRDAT